MANEAFQWKTQPAAEKLIEDVLEHCCKTNPEIAYLRDELHVQTSTRLFDWLDHIVIGYTQDMEKRLEKAGFVAYDATPNYRSLHHPGAQLPLVVMHDHGHVVTGVAVKVESIADYLMVRGITGHIEGTPYSGYRRCQVSVDGDIALWVIERRGTKTMEPIYTDEAHIQKYIAAQEMWQTRPRSSLDEEAVMDRTLDLAEELVSMLGESMAAWVVCEVERKFWQSRNHAGVVQKGRQDRLGMGWANHDHHTFRSSRKHFPQLVRLFEILGFHCRERFYAGEEAGWGAQVMENSLAGLVLFLDVDLAPHELEFDFAHHAVPDLKNLGTIGLWCALHGDSILNSGMHHMEAQFFFEDLTKDLAHLGLGMMDPFSNFPYLKQAFTAGEIWKVDPRRINKLLKEGKITQSQAEKFEKYGAVGSHLENLQRREGYKGFNQKNVSFIIKKTDPRTLEIKE